MTSASKKLDADSGTVTGYRPRYLLFAGDAQPPRGGMGDLVATFTSEEKARNAFRQLRTQRPSRGSWAQLGVVDADGTLKPVSWFGIGASLDRIPLDPDPPAPSGPGFDARRPRVSKRTTMLLTAMVAVATSMVAVLVDDSGTGRPTSRKATATSVVTSPPPGLAVNGDASPDR